jgi:ketosteroid isomerase-like protein
MGIYVSNKAIKMNKIGLFCLLFLQFSAVQAQTKPLSPLQQQVFDTEKAFAKTMADRNFSGFSTFLSDEAVFFGSDKVLHGKTEVSAAWKSYFDKKDAPFSWEPGQVEVLESGKLALSSGPVKDAEGHLIATFSSIWRMDQPGVWHIVFDKGNSVCNCTQK